MAILADSLLPISPQVQGGLRPSSQNCEILLSHGPLLAQATRLTPDSADAGPSPSTGFGQFQFRINAVKPRDPSAANNVPGNPTASESARSSRPSDDDSSEG